jgi:hypothetical protein
MNKPSPSSSSNLVLSGDYYRNFVNAVRAEQTRNKYVYALKKFMLYTKCEDLDRLVKTEPRLVEAQIIDWIVYLRQEQKLSHGIVNLYMSGYTHNNLSSSW